MTEISLSDRAPELRLNSPGARGIENARLVRLQVALGILTQYSDTSEREASLDESKHDRLQRLTSALHVLNDNFPLAPQDEEYSTEDSPEDEDLMRVTLNDEQKALVIEHMRFASFIARKYLTSGEPLEDLTQVAHIGLIKAATRFDPSLGNFIDYAGKTVRGEIQRYFRDSTWSVKVQRNLKDIGVRIFKTQTDLESRLCRPANPQEVAEALGVSVEDYNEARLAWQNYKAGSLDAPLGANSLNNSVGDVIACKNEDIKDAEDKQYIAQLFAHLSPREITILKARAGMDPYDHEYTQHEISQLLGISQVHVGRLETQALEKLYEIGTRA